MDIIELSIFLLFLVCFCIVALALVHDQFAVKVAVWLKSRVEAKAAYRSALRHAVIRNTELLS